ncbi:DHHW family protein [Fusibacter tunisiensis]|uniref:AlgX/AlgJ SGNH hydrolase-like domain-containing protein n=1 Tax=Fusibacter tunisiensis TaxID=1008308 RepID=A0ABS2MP65_9FIRM|nr:DHHW family protein [Fusibacter tunisiensis]MBM7561185.1 hypothetical protein [Fusibacter tunisiensis]
MKQKQVKNKGIVWMTTLFVLVGTVMQVFTNPPEISYVERRKLMAFPDLNLERILNTAFMSDLEIHLADTFPLRGHFRTLKWHMGTLLFNRQEIDDYYQVDHHLSKLTYPLNEKQVEIGAEKINGIIDRYLKDLPVYFSIVPDKNYYLAEDNGYPSMDYNQMVSIMKSQVEEALYIDLFNVLTLDDYYQTDPHWNQNHLNTVLAEFSEAMAFEWDYSKYELEKGPEFIGAYGSQIPGHTLVDSMDYLVSQCVIDSSLYTLDTDLKTTVYTPNANLDMDPYSFFMGGPAAIQVIERNQSETGCSLILFRDSFGSSIAPLFLAGYDKITLVDLRYVSSDMLDHYIEFENQDVLFLYSTLVLNQSIMLR